MTTAHEGESHERLHRRATFDAVTANYDRGRPGYPDALFDDIIRLSELTADARILEIGPGTGHATLPFAKHGYHIDAIELGENLGSRWRENLRNFPNANLTIGSFESAPIEKQTYDLVFAATSFHWIDPAIGFQKVHDLLRPDGWFALWWNRYFAVPQEPQLSQIARPIYEKWTPELIDTDLDLPDSLHVAPPTGNRLAESGLFGAIEERRYEWMRDFTTAEFIALLDSLSRYRVLDADIRHQLFDELAIDIDKEMKGIVTKGFVTFLYLAQPLPD